MEKPQLVLKESVQCVSCHQPLTTFMAYIPGKGDACLACFAKYAQQEENRSTIKTKKH